ncbi:MAG: alpha amylase C-terminal domain-containing protein [Kiritimatiellae bacterium]|nr:alpha amylase C-terminal domain-containing protein [Kiritimatiellia bacterium]
MPSPRMRLLDDPWLAPYADVIERRAQRAQETAKRLTGTSDAPQALASFASAHEYYGLHRTKDGWIFREWAPNATQIWLVGDFSNWEVRPEFQAVRIPGRDVFDWRGPEDALCHGQFYRLEVLWNGGRGERIPAYARRVVQDPETGLFAAQIWQPRPYRWKNTFVRPAVAPVIYEAHIGMAQEKEGVGSYTEFAEEVLPRIKAAGYNTLQIMGIMEHPYYGSFGYHVSSFFAASSRFGTPEELKALIDKAHGLGIAVIMDIVHSHAVKNERDGLSRFDGTAYQYFHDGSRGWHDAWDSRCFDYGKTDVLHFLLSNCRFWLDEFHFDGYRFDGVTSMLYLHHGLGVDFSNYGMYFDSTVDEDACVYLTLANEVIHTVRPDALTIAEDVSGMPGIGAPLDECGIGFDYRMAMGVPECWFKLVRDMRDEDWSVNFLWHELTNRRADERTVNYVESHDQALVGGKSFIFQMIDKEMYEAMHKGSQNLLVDRGLALHKMARLATLGCCCAYLNFMGNEFGHPEWIDFPREGNNNSYHYARRQWSLRDSDELRFKGLGDFDEAMMKLVVNGRKALEGTYPRRIYGNDEDKVLAFIRGELLFIFNFHSEQSLVDYPLIVPPGVYQHALDTDAEAFGGFNRVIAGQEFPLTTIERENERCFAIRLYLPARTALVIERIPPKVARAGRKKKATTP